MIKIFGDNYSGFYFLLFFILLIVPLMIILIIESARLLVSKGMEVRDEDMFKTLLKPYTELFRFLYDDINKIITYFGR